MQDLLARAWRDDPHAILHPGDLAWWVGWPPKTNEELAARIAVWEDAGHVAAWAMIDDDEVGECVHPDREDDAELRREVDAWLADHPRATRYRRADDGAGQRWLLDAGYRPADDGSMVGFSFRLRDVAPSEPDPRVHTVEPGDDLAPRASITRAAFRIDRPLERYVEQYRVFTGSPAYPRGWDLVARTASGAGAACAIAWPDPISGVGRFEPVATHPDVRRRGFATAVLRDGLRRLRDAGLERAIVCTPSTNEAAIALYRSVGFRDDHVETAFRRP
jgi:RimJ/RimL family protein N-acetyltransferase